MTVQIDLFYAPFCNACRRVRPKLKRLAAPHTEIRLRELDVIEHLDDAVRAGVRTTPTVVVNGQIRLSGAITEAAFRALLNELKVAEST